MRVALAIATAILTIGLATRAMHGQIPAVDAPALKTIRMLDTLTGWAATVEGVMLRTVNGGIQWTDVTPFDPSGQRITAVSHHALNSLVAWAAAGAPSGALTSQIFRTVDGGRTWRHATVGASAESVHSISASEAWVLSTVDVSMGYHHSVDVYRTIDGGETWSRVAIARPNDESSGLRFGGSKDGIYFLNRTTGWITGTGYLFITHDGGSRWRQQTLPPPSQLGSTFRHDLGSPMSRLPVFFTMRDGVLPVFYAELNSTRTTLVFYTTHDGGATWVHTTPVSVAIVWRELSSFADMNHGFVMDGFTLHVTRDGGRRWTVVDATRLPVDVTQLAFVSPQVGWAVRQSHPSLHKTLDGGRTWSPVAYTISR